MAPRPTLKPLITPRTMIFPSELHDRPVMAPYSPTVKSEDGDGSSGSRTAAITPPPAYTEFLNALTPVYGSEFPKSPSDKSPRSTARPSFSLPSQRQKRSPRSLAPYHHNPPSSAPLRLPATPSSASASTPRVPYPERRLPIPTPSPSTSSSSYHPYNMSTDYYYTSSPRSAQSTYSYSLRSPYSPDWKTRHMESPRSASS